MRAVDRKAAAATRAALATDATVTRPWSQLAIEDCDLGESLASSGAAQVWEALERGANLGTPVSGAGVVLCAVPHGSAPPESPTITALEATGAPASEETSFGERMSARAAGDRAHAAASAVRDAELDAPVSLTETIERLANASRSRRGPETPTVRGLRPGERRQDTHDEIPCVESTSLVVPSARAVLREVRRMLQYAALERESTCAHYAESRNAEEIQQESTASALGAVLGSNLELFYDHLLASCVPRGGLCAKPPRRAARG